MRVSEAFLLPRPQSSRGAPYFRKLPECWKDGSGQDLAAAVGHPDGM